MKRTGFFSNLVNIVRKTFGWCPEPPTSKYKDIEKVEKNSLQSYWFENASARAPKTELSLDFPPVYVFDQLLDFFQTAKFGSIEYSEIKKTRPSHMEGKWFIGPPLFQWLGGNLNVDLTKNNNETRVELKVSAGNINLLAFVGFVIGLPFLMIPPSVFIGLMFCGLSVAIFLAGQWRKNNILRDINEGFSSLPETTEKLERVTVEYEEESIEITETPEGFSVNLPAKNVFNQLVDYFGVKHVKKRILSSYIEGRWAGGPFKIKIVSSNGTSQVKISLSCLYWYLGAVVGFLFSILIFAYDPARGLALGIEFSVFALLIGWWMKRSMMKRLKELFNILARAKKFSEMEEE